MAEQSLPAVPGTILPVMSPHHQHLLSDHRKESVSLSLKMAEVSVEDVDSAASDFLAAKIEKLDNEMSYIATLKAGLDEAHTTGRLSDAEYRTKIAPYTARMRSAQMTLRVLKQQRHVLEEDLSETVEAEKHTHRNHEHCDGVLLLERAYSDMVLTRVVKPERDRRFGCLEHSIDKGEVERYYSTVSECKHKVWCHVLGMFISKRSIKTAHIVPEKLDREQLAHLFGDEDWEPSHPRNGKTLMSSLNEPLTDPSFSLALSLYQKVEGHFNLGNIAIVPMPGVTKTPTEWRCIVLNESLNMDVVYRGDYRPGQEPLTIRVKDLHNRPLEFLSTNRPLRRYLHIRFLILHMFSKITSVPILRQTVESGVFWSFAGKCFERETLQTFARCVSGCEVSEYFTAEHTFDHPTNPERNIPTGMAMAADLLGIPSRGTVEDSE
ncbi:unnamed protein product [Penicillium salamii]|uniref:HNH nuclease domain-containing protein n=1 Tax=Penicillium salamii TaxID=1612424 RepID=A0A9W4ISH8_9EURO|nr:unnamed protein product [Penicillium salamii]CAG8193751.1 unnamed protein product [Penicillium salamii]CAG8203134.1 unnamed protein product [Penicillium salamii]CAG8207812.1 unnamed protein product [Penicillium salamii]CAG8327797.1 unnamed protein product [Penicillium salamii]